MGKRVIEFIKSFNAVITFIGLVVSGFTYLWAYLRHLQDVEIFVLCLGTFAFVLWILSFFRKGFSKDKELRKLLKIDGGDIYEVVGNEAWHVKSESEVKQMGYSGCTDLRIEKITKEEAQKKYRLVWH